MYRDGRVRGIWTLYCVIGKMGEYRRGEMGDEKKVWGMCMDIWGWEEGGVREIGGMRVRDGENGMGRYGKVEGE